MQWLVVDPRSQQELVLVLPRSQPASPEAMQHWLDSAKRHARIDHPGLAAVVDVGEHDRWPYVAYDRGPTATLAERMGKKGIAPAELVPWIVQVAQGLAFAHEAGASA